MDLFFNHSRKQRKTILWQKRRRRMRMSWGRRARRRMRMSWRRRFINHHLIYNDSCTINTKHKQKEKKNVYVVCSIRENKQREPRVAAVGGVPRYAGRK